MNTGNSGLTRYSPPAKQWPKRARGQSRRKIKTPDQLWKSMPRKLARVTAGSPWANDHINTPGIKDDLPVWGDSTDFTRWTAFEFMTITDMRTAGMHLKRVLTLNKFPFSMQQRSLIVPKAAGKIIVELYRTKLRLMSGIPLYIGKCALYFAGNLAEEDRRSTEYGTAMKCMYYLTWIPWVGQGGDEACEESKSFVYATQFDNVKRALMKKAIAEREALAATEAAARNAETAPFDPENPPI